VTPATGSAPQARAATVVRPTRGAAYTDGSRMYRPRSERIVDGAGITAARTVRADVCVIGSGAGGGVVAKELAEGGMSVVILEEGRRWTSDDYTARPREMTTLMFRDAGQIATLGNVPVLLPLGRGLGGSTLINAATCFRTPPAVLEHWATSYGLEGMAPAELDPFFRRVERVLGVAQVPEELAGRNALVVKRGADRLGWSGDFIYRNAQGCVGSGVCMWGCPAAAKQHIGQTYIPRAWDAGAVSYTGCRAQAIERSRGRPRAVEARALGGGRLRVECQLVIVACGAIATPLFRRHQGLGGDSGQLGRNLTLHPASGVRALFDEQIDMHLGVPQSYYIDEFAPEGIMFEGAAGPPDYLAASLPYAGPRHRELMARYRELSQFGILVSDYRSRGLVRERLGNVEIRYNLDADDVARFCRAVELLCECYWAAGARRVYPPLASVPELRDGELEPLRRAKVRARDLTLIAFHPLGTARADARPAHGVVDGDLRVRGVDGVYIADGSVAPSPTGVNTQETIMALGTRLAYHLLGRPAPTDEPEPESIARPRVAAPAVAQ
jgi:choline dehydrogenase-like flavoprotein